jgi:hypothetical protein
MLVRFVRLLGPGAGSFVGGLGRAPAGGLDSALAMGIADGLHDLCARLSEEDLDAMCTELATHTVVVKSRDVELRLSDVFDDHFAGRYDEMLSWFRFAAEVNFASFFAGSSGAGTPLSKLVAMLSAWRPPTESTGTSTASPHPRDTPTA